MLQTCLNLEFWELQHNNKRSFSKAFDLVNIQLKNAGFSTDIESEYKNKILN